MPHGVFMNTFFLWEKLTRVMLVLNCARSSEKHSSHKTRPHCKGIKVFIESNTCHRLVTTKVYQGKCVHLSKIQKEFRPVISANKQHKTEWDLKTVGKYLRYPDMLTRLIRIQRRYVCPPTNTGEAPSPSYPTYRCGQIHQGTMLTTGFPSIQSTEICVINVVFLG